MPISPPTGCGIQPVPTSKLTQSPDYAHVLCNLQNANSILGFWECAMQSRDCTNSQIVRNIYIPRLIPGYWLQSVTTYVTLPTNQITILDCFECLCHLQFNTSWGGVWLIMWRAFSLCRCWRQFYSFSQGRSDFFTGERGKERGVIYYSDSCRVCTTSQVG